MKPIRTMAEFRKRYLHEDEFLLTPTQRMERYLQRLTTRTVREIKRRLREDGGSDE